MHVAYEPFDAGAAMRDLVGPDVNLFPQNGAGLAGKLANASVLALAGGAGPLLIAWPELMHWRPEHAESLIDDGQIDLVGMARQLLADPDWPRKGPPQCSRSH